MQRSQLAAASALLIAAAAAWMRQAAAAHPAPCLHKAASAQDKTAEVGRHGAKHMQQCVLCVLHGMCYSIAAGFAQECVSYT
jgi:hypothetical protein